jgi:signal peptidase II
MAAYFKAPARPLFWGLLLALLTVLVDQASKYAMMVRLNVFRPGDMPAMEEVTSFLNWTVVWNRGVSFGMFAADGWTGAYVLSAISLIVSVALVVWLRRADRWVTLVGIALVLGGAVGNVLDRLRFGAVFDFIDFHFGTWHPFVFNVADAGINIGVILLLIEGMVFPKK